MIFFQKIALFFIFSCSFFLTSCSKQPVEQSLIKEEASEPLVESLTNKGVLVNVHVIDFNGFSETITNKERLKQFEKRDFLQPQQYRKVLRIYRRSNTGDSISLITLYHENGHIFRYVECVNGRASGSFREWYNNGKLAIESTVESGSADLDDSSISEWTFHGLSRAWTSQGKKQGLFYYKHGLLHGLSTTYYPNGEIEWQTEYSEGKKNGFERLFREDGSLLQESQYSEGLRNGPSKGYWTSNKKKYDEEFQRDSLIDGVYYNDSEEIVSQVIQGEGTRSIFNDDMLISQYQISDGKPAGWVKIYSEETGQLEREYSQVDGKKNGREIFYYPQKTKDNKIQSTPQKKLAIDWKMDMITGSVETWYPNGSLESRKEMKQNKRDGICLIWYPDGNLMLLEEYEKDTLKKGRYHKKGEEVPYSTVDAGFGTATIFDSEEALVEKISYKEGKPIVQK